MIYDQKNKLKPNFKIYVLNWLNWKENENQFLKLRLTYPDAAVGVRTLLLLHA